MNLRRAAEGALWYIREVSGESDYDKYVAHARCEHPDADVLGRREFERRKMDQRDATPQARCC